MVAHCIEALQKFPHGQTVGLGCRSHPDFVVRQHNVVNQFRFIELFANVGGDSNGDVVVEAQLGASQGSLAFTESSDYGGRQDDSDFPGIILRHLAEVAEKIIAEHVLQRIGQYAAKKKDQPRKLQPYE